MLCKNSNDVIKIVKEEKCQLHPVLVHRCAWHSKKLFHYPIRTGGGLVRGDGL